MGLAAAEYLHICISIVLLTRFSCDKRLQACIHQELALEWGKTLSPARWRLELSCDNSSLSSGGFKMGWPRSISRTEGYQNRLSGCHFLLFEHKQDVSHIHSLQQMPSSFNIAVSYSWLIFELNYPWVLVFYCFYCQVV